MKRDDWSYEKARIKKAFEMMTDAEKRIFRSFSSKELLELVQDIRTAQRMFSPSRTIMESESQSTEASAAAVKIKLKKDVKKPHLYHSMADTIIVEDNHVNLPQAIRLSMMGAEQWVELHFKTMDDGSYYDAKSIIDE